ncbi:MAG: hypothetical protein AVDCRST_MAG93-7688 [uncultured Chloroflexia bacterium]|uniref:Uncharacterized protein n=1 Tax=uncultured Chloroflexia bacterium TaxID=1672391 RepID=A0A6J4MK26_9CHLR|nr:MAG: hypothetical protein AVDCRST_MAG93-7688 [uncultured Chloroflexia bacterium]
MLNSGEKEHIGHPAYFAACVKSLEQARVAILRPACLH